MSRTPNFDDVRRNLGSHLHTGEEVMVVAQARLPVPKTQIVTFVSIGILIRLVDFALLRWRTARMLARGAELRFPVAPWMDLVVTDRRLIVLGRRRRTKALGTFVGDIPRSHITRASMPYVGYGRWKIVRIEQASGVIVQLPVERDGATEVVSALTSPLPPALSSEE